VIKESIKLNWWHNAVKKLEKVKSKFYCKYKVNGKTKKKTKLLHMVSNPDYRIGRQYTYHHANWQLAGMAVH